MAHDARPAIAAFGEEFPFHSNGQDWVTSWHPPGEAPEGNKHGSTGVCLTNDGYVVLISVKGVDWSFPAGRPEEGENWRQTLEREMWEEACARIESATLLGYNRGRCIRGHEAGLVLVRSMWRVEVDLSPWKPEYEIPFRALVRPSLVLPLIRGEFPEAIMRRWLHDALGVEADGD